MSVGTRLISAIVAVECGEHPALHRRLCNFLHDIL
jgi:hypothetical protein